MKKQELVTALRQVEQLALGLQLALKHSPPEIREVLGKTGLTLNRRVAIQRQTWCLVGSIRKALSQMGQTGVPR